MSLLRALKGRIVVSCQAYEGEALFGSDTMARMALAAKEGGAGAIRANGPGDIRAIKAAAGLPVIGIWKKPYADSDVYITPTLADSRSVRQAGADVIAMDGTLRGRPCGERLERTVQTLRKEGGALLMADISTWEEGTKAAALGFDLVATTLSGYTAYSTQSASPDFELLARLVADQPLPVVAEGRIMKPDEARRCLELGAHCVVVGTAITRPQVLTRRFVDRAAGASPAVEETRGERQ